MFDVEMLVINNSLTDTIENCETTLDLPDGLSLASMVDGNQSATQTIPYIAEGESKSVHWYVRGDKEGTYDISASLSGMLMPFEEEFSYDYVAKSPIKVYAGSAMHITYVMPDSAFYGEDYKIKIILENVSNKTLYGITNMINGFEQGQVTYYSDGKEEKKEFVNEGGLGYKYMRELKPGDKMTFIVGNFGSETEQRPVSAKKPAFSAKCNVDGTETELFFQYNEAIVPPADPVKPGYIFKGWTPDIPATMPANNLTFTAVFEPIVLKSIAIASSPKTAYDYKQDFDPAGMTLTATYSDGTTRTITETAKMSVTGYDKTKTGTQDLTVKYEDCEAKITVTVKLTWWQWLIKILLFGWLWY